MGNGKCHRIFEQDSFRIENQFAYLATQNLISTNKDNTTASEQISS